MNPELIMEWSAAVISVCFAIAALSLVCAGVVMLTIAGIDHISFWWRNK